MSEEASPGSGAVETSRRSPQWLTQVVLPVTVAVLGTLLVTALTPIGESVRELLFPTRAAVSGSVLLDGQPAGNAGVKLDGRAKGNADGDGRFFLTSVGRGAHRMRLETTGAKPRDWAFTVDSGQTKLDIGAIQLQPFVRLGYSASVTPWSSAEGVNYDLTLWIRGDLAGLSSIKSVSFKLPAPLPAAPVSGASGEQAFCYRQTGGLSLQDLFGGAFGLAAADVDLGDGHPFQISAEPGEDRPPNCSAHQASGAQAQQESGQQGPIQMGHQSPPPPTQHVQTVTVPDVAGKTRDKAQQILQGLSFNVQVVRQASADVDKDIVIGTDPAAGTEALKGSTIRLLVSTGSEQVQIPVPLVKGRKVQDAEAVLSAAYLHIATEVVPSGADQKNVVVDQDPPAGTLVDPGSTVTVKVGDGSVTTSQPTSTRPTPSLTPTSAQTP
jgi:hypothetical protein